MIESVLAWLFDDQDTEEIYIEVFDPRVERIRELRDIRDVLVFELGREPTAREMWEAENGIQEEG